MVRIKGVEYDGSVRREGDDLLVTINSEIPYNDLLSRVANTKEVEQIDEAGNATTYVIARPISAWIIGRNVYEIQYGTKMTAIQRLEAQNQELSDAIDDILVMMLEGR